MPALYIQLTGQTGCCGNRLGMLVSIIFAGVGAVGAAYCFIVALIGLHNGPLCNDGDKWTRPFADRDPNYMTKSSWWTECLEPKNVVQFNMGLFITLMAASCLQVVLCVIQVINGLVGCLCGTGNEK
ncbi:transmembrane 4 L6 family member 1-like [Cynoglossus semilaevis]|nr:transmembrane 4 L6 family member 1-like [Cynoglossus semilaevis]